MKGQLPFFSKKKIDLSDERAHFEASSAEQERPFNLRNAILERRHRCSRLRRF